ncbi:MAG: prepilin-type N-terminal cleavage/methylation domain-containing protein [bacterium]|nr:prepilin-type N-terminal cleavage/methylation domain-containing protein [bacterium]
MEQRKIQITTQHGFSFIELMVTLAIIGILASVVLPLTKITVKRNKEIELRRSLREIRKSIDNYKIKFDELKTEFYSTKRDIKKEELYKKFKVEEVDRMGYPLTLQELLELKFLRRIPEDPFTGSQKWATRSYSDAYDSKNTDGNNIYDVYSTSEEEALDGTKYSNW